MNHQDRFGWKIGIENNLMLCKFLIKGHLHFPMIGVKNQWHDDMIVQLAQIFNNRLPMSVHMEAFSQPSKQSGSDCADTPNKNNDKEHLKSQRWNCNTFWFKLLKFDPVFGQHILKIIILIKNYRHDQNILAALKKVAFVF